MPGVNLGNVIFMLGGGAGFCHRDHSSAHCRAAEASSSSVGGMNGVRIRLYGAVQQMHQIFIAKKYLLPITCTWNKTSSLTQSAIKPGMGWKQAALRCSKENERAGRLCRRNGAWRLCVSRCGWGGGEYVTLWEARGIRRWDPTGFECHPGHAIWMNLRVTMFGLNTQPTDQSAHGAGGTTLRVLRASSPCVLPTVLWWWRWQASPFSRWGNWGLQGLNDFSKVTQERHQWNAGRLAAGPMAFNDCLWVQTQTWLHAHFVDGENKAQRRAATSLRVEPGFEPRSSW